MAHIIPFWKDIRTADSLQQRFLPVPRSLSASLPSSQCNSLPNPFQFSFATPEQAPQLEDFLQENFTAGCAAANAGNTITTKPRLVVPLRPSDTELVLQAFPAGNNPILQQETAGCIRFKKSGYFEGKSIHAIDAFCVHPTYRKKGLATALLTTLHVETQARGLHYSLFLKEGAPLPISQVPLYSSLYVYCKTADLTPSLSSLSPSSIFNPSIAQVSACIRAYQALRPNTFIYWDSHNRNQTWRMWRSGHSWMLLCVQDAYQELESNTSPSTKERIGWVTALLESPDLPSNPFRASILESLLKTTKYPWIWTDASFVPLTSSSAAWRVDGAFHWYSYGWTTYLRPGSNYVLVV